MRTKRWAVFISGRGSNLGALIQSSSACHIAVVLSSNAQAAGVKRARRSAIPVVVLSKKIDWQAVHQLLLKHRVDRLFLAGFMRILPDEFIKLWLGRTLNVHPSVLPAYPGLKSIERAFCDKAALGVTVHEVTEEVDGGKIIAQKVVFLPAKAPHRFSQAEFRIHVCEHRLVRRSVEQISRLANAHREYLELECMRGASA